MLLEGLDATLGFVRAVTEVVELVANLDDVEVVGQAIQQRSGYLGIAEHRGPRP